MGTPVLMGREFTDADDRNSRRVAIVNESFARRFFHGDAVGRKFTVGDGNEIDQGTVNLEIVGVVANTKYGQPREKQKELVYIAMYQGKRGASGTIQVIHTQPEMCPEPGEVVIKRASATSSVESQMETFKLRELGNESGDPFIRPGDVIIVTEGEPVYITGAVLAPQPIFMKDQLTLGRAIAMAGGPQRLANTGEVHVYRKKDGLIGQEDLKYNYDAIRKGREKDVLLQPYDIIDVRNSGPFAPKSLADLLLNMGRSSAGFLPQRIFY